MTKDQAKMMGRMRVLRIRLERERNSPRPSAVKINEMMAEYRQLEALCK